MPPNPMPPPAMSRWGSLWRYAIVLLFGFGTWAPSTFTAVGTWTWVDLALGLGATVLLRWRRRHAFPVALVIALATAVSAFAGGPMLLAVVSLATRRRWREVLPVLAVAVAATPVLQARIGTPGLDPGSLDAQSALAVSTWAPTVTNLVTVGLLIAWGFYLGARRELVTTLQARADTAEREQAMRMAQARLTERARIAREMHDVIAHRISLVAMHAGALTYREDLTAAETRQTAELIRANAHQALTELRGVLGVLRDPDSPGAALADAGRSELPEPPQPTFEDLPALLDQARSAGTRVQVDGHLPDPAMVPERLGRTAYRMVQETLTNARKHAPGMPVHLAVRGEPGTQLQISVRNPVPATTPRDAPPGAGLGLTGLAERAVLAGGTLEHAATHGEFVVLARLPWPAVPTG